VKTPPDSPTKVGDRVVQRGDPGRNGTVVRINADRPTWMFILWDEGGGGPGICHQNELRVCNTPTK
jgi:hypothetical protein